MDEDKNMVTYDYKGNKMVVNKAKVDGLPRLNYPKLSVPANSSHRDSLGSIREGAKRKSAMSNREKESRNQS